MLAGDKISGLVRGFGAQWLQTAEFRAFMPDARLYQEYDDELGDPETQFGRSMQELGVRLIKARSPQAKGCVERMNGTLQDRLVKALRRAGISDLDSANRFLEEFLDSLNARFTVAAAAARPLKTNPK